MDPLLAGKAAVVTGASSGIGREMASTFAEHGAAVVVADVREEPRGGGTPTHELVQRETDADAVYVECDVTERADLESAVASAEEFGGIDVMVNNAGVAAFGPLLETTEAEFERSMAVNQKGVFFGCQAAIPPMIEQGEGRIVNMSSIAGIRGWAESALYCMSKAAVTLLTYTVAAEFGPEGVRANALHPGTIRTEMTETSTSTGSRTATTRSPSARSAVRGTSPTPPCFSRRISVRTSTASPCPSTAGWRTSRAETATRSGHRRLWVRRLPERLQVRMRTTGAQRRADVG